MKHCFDLESHEITFNDLKYLLKENVRMLTLQIKWLHLFFIMKSRTKNVLALLNYYSEFINIYVFMYFMYLWVIRWIIVNRLFSFSYSSLPTKCHYNFRYSSSLQLNKIIKIGFWKLFNSRFEFMRKILCTKMQ